jgi:hypothetical protein
MGKSYCVEFDGIGTEVNLINFCVDSEKNIFLQSDAD